MGSMWRRALVVLVLSGMLAGVVLGACGGDESGTAGGPKGTPDGSAGEAAVDAAMPDAEGDADAKSDADATLAPDPGNALLLSDGTLTALYPVSAAGATTRAVAFVRSGSEVTALDEYGAELWTKDLGPGAMGGGFDFDADGIPDLLLARSADSGQICGGQAMLDTSLDVARGADGELVTLTGPLASLCWTFGSITYPTPQWTVLDALFGAGTPTLFVSPYYATQGSFLSFDGSAFQDLGDLWYPSSASYDSTYVNDQPNAYGGPESFTTNPHVANGLLYQHAGATRLLFFTSSRVVQYAVGPVGPDQLLVDTPFLPTVPGSFAP
jgi:hypothetical protein